MRNGGRVRCDEESEEKEIGKVELTYLDQSWRLRLMKHYTQSEVAEA